MFHLDNNSGVSSMPAVGAMQDNTTRWFTEGAGNQSPSWPGQDWFNIVQAELLNVLTEGGVSPVKTQLNQLAAAIKSIVNKNALMRDNLLSEIKDKGASAQKSALDNLNGVPKTTTINGHSLTGNVNVTSQDIFGEQSVRIPGGANLNTYTTAGIYFQPMTADAQSGTNYPEALAGTLVVYKNATPGATQVYYIYNSSRVYTRGQYNSGAWQPWAKQYNNQNKPSPAELGALPTGGGTMTGPVLTASREGAGSFASQYTEKAPFHQDLSVTIGSGGTYVPVVKQRLTASGAGANYSYAISTGTLLSPTSAAWNVHIKGSAGQEYYCRLSTEGGGKLTLTGQVVPSSYANFDARYQAKGSYTPAGQAYTKAESDGRYLQGVRFGAEASKGNLADNTAHKAPAGYALTGFTKGSGGNPITMFYKPIQRNINGSWVTISG